MKKILLSSFYRWGKLSRVVGQLADHHTLVINIRHEPQPSDFRVWWMLSTKCSHTGKGNTFWENNQCLHIMV